MATSKIVDLHGRPIELPDLDVPQTEANALLATLHRHYSSHPSSGLTVSRIANILKAGEDGDLVAQCELAEDMEEKDAHLQSELGKRKLAMQSIDWRIVPPRNASAAEKRDAGMIDELLRDATWLYDAMFDMDDAILKGFSNLELEWGFAENTHYINNYEWRDPAWFKTHPDNRNQLMLRDGSHTGEALKPFGWISHCSRSKSGYLSRRGLMRVLAWPFLFKNYSVRDLAEILEIHGLPLRLGKYPEGASEREKATLLRAVMSIGHNAGGIIPKGMSIEFEKASEGSSDPFMAMISWAEKSMSKAILGGTLTSQADGASSTNALGNVHNEVREEIRDSDLRGRANTLTRDVVYPLYALNGISYRSPRRIPRFEFDIYEPEDLVALSQGLRPLVEMGVQVPISYVTEKTRIPLPENNEPVLSLSAAAPPSTDAELKALAVLKAEQDTLLPSDTVLDDALALIDDNTLNEQLRPVLQPIMAIAAEGPQALGAALAEIYPQMDDEQLTQKLAQVIFVSELWGQLNA